MNSLYPAIELFCNDKTEIARLIALMNQAAHFRRFRPWTLLGALAVAVAAAAAMGIAERGTGPVHTEQADQGLSWRPATAAAPAGVAVRRPQGAR
jgi:hypothetical protein